MREQLRYGGVLTLKVIIESPKGRVYYDTVDTALDALREWLDRPAEVCRGITIGVHTEDENCDHETRP